MNQSQSSSASSTNPILTDELCNRMRLLDPELQVEVDAIKDLCSRQQISNAAMNMILFQKYTESCDLKIKALKSEGNKDGLVFDIPKRLYDINDSELIGWNALRTSFFWFRLFTAIFSMISFILLANTSLIGGKSFHPQRLFFRSCKLCGELVGHFPNAPYQGLLGVGLIVYLYSMSCLVYYILPIDEQGKKYLPGWNECWSRTTEYISQYTGPINFNSGITVNISSRLGGYCSSLYQYCHNVLPLLMDVTLFVLSITFCIIASIQLERSVEYTWVENFSIGGQTVQSELFYYFTIGSFFATFTRTSPKCVDESYNPDNEIRAALGMMYLASAILAFNCLVSYRSYRIRSTSLNVVEQRPQNIQEDPQIGQSLLTKSNENESSEDTQTV